MKIESIQLYRNPPSVRINYQRQNSEYSYQNIELPPNVEQWKTVMLKNKILQHYKDHIDEIIMKLKPAPFKLPKLSYAIKPHIGQVMSVISSKSGDLCASCGFDGQVFLHNTVQHSLSALKHTGPVINARFSPFTSDLIATGSLDGYVRIFDCETLQQKQCFPNKDARPVLSLCFDGHKVGFGYESGFAYVSDVEKGVFFKLTKHAAEVIQIENCGSVYYTAGFDGFVYRNDVRELHETARLGTTSTSHHDYFLAHDEPITQMIIKNNSLLTCSEDKLQLIDMRMQNKFLISLKPKSIIKGADVNYRQQIVYSDYTKTYIVEQNGQQSEVGESGCPRFMIDNSIVVNTEDQGLKIYSSKNEQVLQIKEKVSSFDVSYGSEKIVMGKFDGGVAVYGE